MEQKNYQLFEDFFDDLEDVNAMTSEREVAVYNDNSSKSSVYIIFNGSFSVNKITNRGFSGESLDVKFVYESIKTIVSKFLNMLQFISDVDVEFYTNSYHPENCDKVHNIGKCVVHYEKITDDNKSFGVRIFFDGKARNAKECVKFMFIMNRIFETIMTKLAYTKHYFIVPYRENDEYYKEDSTNSIYVDGDLIELYNISTADRFNKLSQNNKSEILFLLREVCDCVDLPSQIYNYYKTDISKEILSAQSRGQKSKKISNTVLEYGDFDILELINRISVNHPMSGCVKTINMHTPKNIPDEFKDVAKCADISTKQKIGFKCMLRNVKDFDFTIVVYSNPIIIDNEEYILYFGAHRDLRELLGKFYKDYRKEKTMDFYRLLEYCKFDVQKVLDYMVKNISDFNEEYKIEILGYLNEE